MQRKLLYRNIFPPQANLGTLRCQRLTSQLNDFSLSLQHLEMVAPKTLHSFYCQAS